MGLFIVWGFYTLTFFAVTLAPGDPFQNLENPKMLNLLNPRKILDRKEAIKKALTMAQASDIVVMTGKGSETSMAIAGGKKIPWSDKRIVNEFLGS